MKHRRHYAVQGETVCPRCEKIAEITKNQNSLFDHIEVKPQENEKTV